MKMYGEIWRNYPSQGNEYYKVGDYRKLEPCALSTRLKIRVTGVHMCGCSGKANQILHPELNGSGDYGSVVDTMSWGYEGPGSDLLAGYILATALHGRVISEDRFAGINAHHLQIIQRHYKQFSAEVIANLPEEWELDMNWVKQWIMEREKQS